MTLIDTAVTPAARKAVPKVNGALKPQKNIHETTPSWSEFEKVTFRFFCIYFLILAVPLDWKYYRDVFSLDWSSLYFSNLFYLARYAPRFFSEVPEFTDWFVVAVIAIIGTITWSIVDTKSKEYNNLYYWLRVVLRYRLAVALLAYGFIKFFPLQMPFPSISNLNTNYGDIAAWKLFSMSTGIVPGYQSFLGLIEIFAALLLLYRKTAIIGAFIVLPFTGNVVMSNLAYEGGEYQYALLLVTYALFLVAYDARRLISLTSLEKFTAPNRFKPQLTERWKNARLILKSTFVFVFVFFYGYRTYASYREEVYHYPKAPGLTNASGIYNVKEFKVNNKVLPYSVGDPVRWRDVVFEKWATLSVRSNEPAELITSSTEEIFLKDKQRIYELSGTAGRHYYSYEVDSVNHNLILQNKNENHAGDKLTFHYSRPDSNTIILSGINQKNDSLLVVLEKIDKKYLLDEAARHGRRRGLKL